MRPVISGINADCSTSKWHMKLPVLAVGLHVDAKPPFAAFLNLSQIVGFECYLGTHVP